MTGTRRAGDGPGRGRAGAAGFEEREPAGVGRLAEAFGRADPVSREIVRAACHDLRTPLTGIAGFVELLADGAAGPVTARQEQILEIIAQSAARLGRMLDSLEAGAHGRSADPGGSGGAR